MMKTSILDPKTPSHIYAFGGSRSALFFEGLTGLCRFSERPMGVRIRGTLGEKDPLNKAPFKRATSRVQKGPL